MIFDSSNTSATIEICIETNDTHREEDEEFTVNLSFPGEPVPRVILEPDSVTVTIIEFDGEGNYTHAHNHVLRLKALHNVGVESY